MTQFRRAGEPVSLWEVRRDSERLAWTLVPLVSVGPLRFGAGHDEITDALDGLTPGSGKMDWRTRIWTQARYQELGVTLYYADQRLNCVAVDGRSGPQVIFEGTALTGRAPSAIEQWMVDQARLRGRELRYTHAGDSELADLGLISRVQRAGDVLVSRPVFLGQRAEVTWDTVPGDEWNTFC